MDKSKGKKIAGLVSAVLGTIAILLSLVFFLTDFLIDNTFNRVGDKKLTAQTDGIVESLDYSDGRTFGNVAYTVNGKKLTVRTSFSSDTMAAGDEVTVHYSPQQPQRAAVEVPEVIHMLLNVFLYIAIGVLFIGVVFIVVSVCMFSSARKCTEGLAEVTEN